jgi:transposase InsO family protein
MGHTRQSFYERSWHQKASQADEEAVLALVHGVRCQMPLIGTRKLYHLLHRQFEEKHLVVGRDKLFTLLRNKGLLVAKRRRYTRTTDSRHWMRKYNNLVKDVTLERPEQVFVSDITYISTKRGYNYLSLVTDACSKKIMGYALREDLSPKGCLQALEMALENRTSDAPLIHHSDRGLQYCSKDYVEALRNHDVDISMTENGDPYENAIAERVNGILKEEFYLSETFASHQEANSHIQQSIQTYNTQRPHLSCHMMTPEAAHTMSTLSPKDWKRKTKKGPQVDLVSPQALTQKV